MPPRRRVGKRLVKSFLPIALVIVLAVVGALSFVVYCVTRPTKRPYVVTPESFSRISAATSKPRFLAITQWLKKRREPS